MEIAEQLAQLRQVQRDSKQREFMSTCHNVFRGLLATASLYDGAETKTGESEAKEESAPVLPVWLAPFLTEEQAQAAPVMARLFFEHARLAEQCGKSEEEAKEEKEEEMEVPVNRMSRDDVVVADWQHVFRVVRQFVPAAVMEKKEETDKSKLDVYSMDVETLWLRETEPFQYFSACHIQHAETATGNTQWHTLYVVGGSPTSPLQAKDYCLWSVKAQTLLIVSKQQHKIWLVTNQEVSERKEGLQRLTFDLAQCLDGVHVELSQ